MPDATTNKEGLVFFADAQALPLHSTKETVETQAKNCLQKKSINKLTCIA